MNVSCLVVAIRSDALSDGRLREQTAEYIGALLSDAVVPVVLFLDRTTRECRAEIADLEERVRGNGGVFHTAAFSEVEQIARGKQPRPCFVVPDAASPSLDDTHAIALSATLHATAVFLTGDRCLRAAESQTNGKDVVLEHVSFVEMLEIAHQHDPPVSAEAVERAWLSNTPFKIYSLRTGRWTTVTPDTYEKRVRAIASVTSQGDLNFVTATRSSAASQPFAAQGLALALLARQAVRIEQIRFLDDGISFACDTRDANAAVACLQRAKFRVCSVPCVRLCVIGSGLQAISGALHAMARALQDASISPLHVADSAVTTTFVVTPEDAAQAELALRSAFLTDQRLRPPVDGHITFDAITRTLRVRDRSERLGRRQAKLLHLLMQNVGKPVDIRSAARAVFGSDDTASIAALRVHVHNIRKKIEDDPVDPQYILTVPNQGYTFARHLGVALHDGTTGEKDQPAASNAP